MNKVVVVLLAVATVAGLALGYVGLSRHADAADAQQRADALAVVDSTATRAEAAAEVRRARRAVDRLERRREALATAVFDFFQHQGDINDGFNEAAALLRAGDVPGAQALARDRLEQLVADGRAMVDEADAALPRVRPAQEQLTEALG